MADHAAPFDARLVRLRRARRERGPSFLQERVLDELAERLAGINRRFSRAIVFGAPPGAFSGALERAGARAKIDALFEADVAPLPGGVAFDPEALPLAPESLDLFVAAWGLHWTNDLPGALVQIRRALKPDGLFLAAMLGGDTLRELRDALLEAESATTGGAALRVGPFADLSDAAALLQRAGFALPVADLDRARVRYADPFALLQDLRAMGETAALRDRPPPLRRATLLAAMTIYAERFADADGRIRATFDVLHLSGWAPAPDQPKPLKPGSATARLADALGVVERGAGERAG